VISAYLETLRAALSFDPSLAQCVRHEVEDHLREAVAADPMGDGLAAERRAIANFGDPNIIAAQFAVISVMKRTRRACIAIIVVIAGAFMAMKARIAWYAVTQQWVVSEDVRAVSEVVGSIDRYAFWVSLIIGVVGWTYIGGRRIPPVFDSAFRRQLHRCFLLCTLATGALVVSVISDGVLTALQLSGAQLSAEFLVPILSVVVEIAGATVLVSQVCNIARRTAFMEAKPRT
jgi:hypothetical protein